MKKTFYEFHKSKTGIGSFEYALLNAYTFADIGNKEILAAAFPELFVERHENW